MRISAVIITKNEEKRIFECLQSLAGVADEIVVLDSFSSDHTVSIAEKSGAKVFQEAFEGYGASKNKANALCTGDYILSLDADERLDEELRKSILAIKSVSDTMPVYQMQRLNNYCGKWIRHGAWNPDRKIRLWRKGVGHWDLSEVHERLILSEQWEPELLAGNILHYSYATKEEHMSKIRKYAEKGALELKKKGKKPLFIQRFISPSARWFRDFILNRGFLDGSAGLEIANLSAYEVWLKYTMY